ncbi:MAG TPA: diphosphomevalonate decarboxylase [Spirochaetia bacterium]|nr:diphosphomevalonate decarboxylase [Spirochaetia bacterium]
MGETTVCVASPSLALIKYWGKQGEIPNTPATGSLAVTLGGLETRTSVTISDAAFDEIAIDGISQPADRFAPFFDNLRNFLCRSLESSERFQQVEDPSALRFRVLSTNNFPTAAGIASSSSGFAALAGACTAAAGIHPPVEELSALARTGSGSAARSIYGGFVILPAGALHATAVYPSDWWPDLRVVIAVVRTQAKEHSSRDAMERSRLTSPYYPAWIESSQAELSAALTALAGRDITSLGKAMRRSYLRMFATMFSADPPLIYWQPESVAVIHACAGLRERGVAAWETMDAGPQVKILTVESQVSDVCEAVSHAAPAATTIIAEIGGGIRFPTADEGFGEADSPR